MLSVAPTPELPRSIVQWWNMMTPEQSEVVLYVTECDEGRFCYSRAQLTLQKPADASGHDLQVITFDLADDIVIIEKFAFMNGELFVEIGKEPWYIKGATLVEWLIPAAAGRCISIRIRLA